MCACVDIMPFCITLVQNITAQEKGQATDPKPMTCAVMWSFSHASHKIGHDPSSPIAPFVPVTGVPSTATT